jgi:multiple sugar transport system permease protein
MIRAAILDGANGRIQKEKRLLQRTRARNLLPAAPFVLPGLILACVFVLYPMLFNIRISFSDYQIVPRTMTWAGIRNYTALFSDTSGRLWLAIRNNLLYAAVTTPFIMFFGLIFAVMLERLRHGRVPFRVLFYLPVITSWVIVGNVFAYMFNAGQRGLINYFLVDVLGLNDAYIPFLQRTWSPTWLSGSWAYGKMWAGRW